MSFLSVSFTHLSLGMLIPLNLEKLFVLNIPVMNVDSFCPSFKTRGYHPLKSNSNTYDPASLKKEELIF